MIFIEPITLANLPAFKETRLRALQEAPGAFGATYAHESELTGEEWKDRVLRCSGESAIRFLAFEDGVACGIAGCFLNTDNPSRAELVSMWTAPSHRQRGIGRMLVNAVAAWAQARGATVLDLFVVANNHAAIGFYQRLGFFQTGRTQPYPNDSTLIEYQMARALTPP
jgi:ribosomal protein S18 acetylase RimI-like enzyme